MFSHIVLGVKDMAASKAFYDATLGGLGVPAPFTDERGRNFYITPKGVLGLTLPIDGEEATHGNGSTIGFACDSPEQADAWHAAGLANGGTSCEDPPGVRAGSTGKLYLAYLRDPAGNKLCALHRMG